MMFTENVDSKEKHDVMTSNLPNAFILIDMLEDNRDEECVIMKITEVILGLLV